MTIYDIIAFSPVILLAYAIWQHNRISLIARAAARQHCNRAEVQLLDHTIILEKITIQRSTQSLLAFRRRYLFEFCTVGDIRYPGYIELLGKRIEHIELTPFKPIPTNTHQEAH